MMAVEPVNSEYRDAEQPQSKNNDKLEQSKSSDRTNVSLNDNTFETNRPDGAGTKDGSSHATSLIQTKGKAPNHFHDKKPHDLPLIVQTSGSGETHETEVDFNEGLGGDEEEDAFPSEFAPIFEGSLLPSSRASVKDLIKKFGSPSRVGISPRENNNNNNCDSSLGGSVRSGSSRHADAPRYIGGTGSVGARPSRDDDSSSWAEYSVTSMPVILEPAVSPDRNRTKTELDMLREKSIVSGRRRLQIRSAARRDRLHYRLGAGRKGMSEKDIRRSRTFLPADKVIEMKQEVPSPPKAASEPELYVWLMSPTTKIFEVVRVPLLEESTIGEVLAGARGAALDPVLAEQRYVSLCNDKLELVAPTLPVTFLFDRKKDTQSVMAVPEGSCALLIREIRKVLMENRRVRKWLKQKDIFRPPTEDEKEARRRARRTRREEKEKEREQQEI